MGETEPVWLQIHKYLSFGVNIQNFGGVWTLSFNLLFVSFGVEFRRPREVKWFKFDNFWYV